MVKRRSAIMWKHVLNVDFEFVHEDVPVNALDVHLEYSGGGWNASTFHCFDKALSFEALVREYIKSGNRHGIPVEASTLELQSDRLIFEVVVCTQLQGLI